MWTEQTLRAAEVGNIKSCKGYKSQLENTVIVKIIDCFKFNGRLNVVKWMRKFKHKLNYGHCFNWFLLKMVYDKKIIWTTDKTID